MATTAIAVATMKVAQISNPGAISRSSNARSLNCVQDTCGSRCKPVAFATVTCSRKRDCDPEFSFPVFQDMKLRALSTNWAKVFPRGRRGSV
jgi:hypothetical protein